MVHELQSFLERVRGGGATVCPLGALSRFGLALVIVTPLTGIAQQQPDAGQTLQQQQMLPQLPRTGPAIDIQTPVAATTTPGGAEVTLASVSIAGASVFTEAELLIVLGDVGGKRYDLAGLRGLADRLSAYYRESGYPFARAYLPPQGMEEGKLRIEVVEGRYGKVQAIGDEALISAASEFLVGLKSSAVINSDDLERTTLILDDQPGIQVAPIIRPGQEIGTGDLDVRIARTPGFGGDIGVDNHGNRFTGEHRLRANLQWDSPFSFGDQVAVRLLYSDEKMWLGSLNYSLPLGASGLRGNIGLSKTYYELAKNFAGQGQGLAKVASFGLAYPIIRSQKANLNLSATYQRKRLDDEKLTGWEAKSSDSLPLTLGFDQRDGLWGGGITYGSLSYTPGRLKLDSRLENDDSTTGQNTRGGFGKWNLDVARVQATPAANLSLFGRFSTQWANKNLDSSEGFSLGGANGVRAYPSGEGNGDEGWLVQLEARYALGPYIPYFFHDTGRVKINASPASLARAPEPNHRSIGGFGAGVRYNEGSWNADATIGWRTHGGTAQSDGAKRDPRVWFTLGYKF